MPESVHRRWAGLLRQGAGFGLGAAAMVVGLLVYHTLVPPPTPLTPRELQALVAEAMASATPPPARSAQVYAAIQNSLVLIETEFPRRGRSPQQGLGSGVVIDAAGQILTSLHVVTAATQITVTFADGSASLATLRVAQPDKDIAVLQPAQLPPGVVPAILGNPRALAIGDEAYVVGNPFGLVGSLSAGVISGFNRSFRATATHARIDGLIQVDAAVNPGNSGGPLLNRDGQVVGIIAALINPTEQDVFVGIGLAVPIDVAGAAAGLPSY